MKNNTQAYQLKKVTEFMQTMGQDTPAEYTLLTPKVGLFRIHLIDSELYDKNELFDSMRNDNTEKVLDGILDVLYVAYGAMASMGLKYEADAVEYLKPFVFNAEAPQGVMCTYGDYVGYTQQVEFLMQDLRTAMQYETETSIINTLIDIVLLMQKIGAKFNFNIADAFDEVHSSNMSKACSTIADAEATVKKYEDETQYVGYAYWVEQNGKFVVRRSSDDKVLKGLRFFEPNLSKFIVA